MMFESVWDVSAGGDPIMPFCSIYPLIETLSDGWEDRDAG